MTDPDPRTASDDDALDAAEATNKGQSAPAPAEGADDAAPPEAGSPQP